MRYADVAVNLPVHETFTYHVPDPLLDQIQNGHLVEVSFRTAKMAAVVLRLHDEIPEFRTKPLQRILDAVPVLSDAQLNLARWLADSTLLPIGSCVWLMLPPSLTGQSVAQYTLSRDAVRDEVFETLSAVQKRIVNLLYQRGALTSNQLKRALPHKNWQSSVNSLVKQGYVTLEQNLRPPVVKPKMVKAARLIVSPDEFPQVLPHLGRESRRGSVLEVLLQMPQHPLGFVDMMEITGCSTDTIQRLVDEGIVTADLHNQISLVIAAEDAYHLMTQWRGIQVYVAILQFLSSYPDAVGVGEIYKATNSTSRHLYKLEEVGAIALSEEEVIRDPLADRAYEVNPTPILTPPQAEAWRAIQHHLNNPTATPRTFLLYGITGSGKTEVYMQAVAHVLAQGRQAIVLVPEIALTAQLVQRFVARFADYRLSLVHSRLSLGERYDTWRRARAGQLDIMLGARSALFAPLPNIGLIVLDEEHDGSYKQDPRTYLPQNYHAREVAMEMMRLQAGTVILGSATPDVTTMYRAEQGEFRLLSLPSRVLAHRAEIEQQAHQLHLNQVTYETETDANPDIVSTGLPPVHVVDMRQELMAGNRSIFSRQLQENLERVLKAEQQAILFLNRRGTATFVMCRDCGLILACPNCEMPLTYHEGQALLTCHYCGHREPNPTTCPQCHGTRIKYFGSGTQRLDQWVNQLFPQARVLRWDQDTARDKNAHEMILRQFANREADVLVGTQMIAKGLDIPLVTLVGIISGDTALGLPDFRTAERTFQLLTQVAGRAGRSLLGGQVILQTYQPDHYAIVAASHHDYASFYAQEIPYRRQLRYPPYARLARIVFQHNQPIEVEQEAKHVAASLLQHQAFGQFTTTEIVGPTPCFFERINNVFYWHIIIRSPDPVAFLRGVDIGNGVLDIDPISLL